jgi:2-desacetyl-2-hydroxyethyl bacteriochlorophyllide A dehydrogenase
MKAAYLLNNKIHVGEVADPTLGKGQALVKTCACALCASDLHVLHDGERLVNWSRECDGPYHMDLSKPVVLGHEYVGEIIDYGPGSNRPLKIGTRVTSLPCVFLPDAIYVVGLSNKFPGGLGEYMVLDENMLLEIPEALDDERASLTEPLAVGLHYARVSRVTKDDVALVVGCGAIGLAVIAGLKLYSAAPIVAADFLPERRDIALKMGADVVIDPNEMSPYGLLPTLGDRRANLVFECVGAPGMLDKIFRGIVFGGRVIVAGWCLEMDKVFFPSAHFKQLTIEFAGGEVPEDMEAALRAIADGKIDVTPWLGPTIGLSGVAEALDGIADPANPIRTVVDPRKM